MNLTRPILATALGLGATLGTLGLASQAGAVGSGHALFLLTGGSGANKVLTYQRASDGSVSYVGATFTRGQGAIAAGAMADPLASQDGLVLADNNKVLVAVNAGSDTVTVFSVNGTSLRRTEVIGSGGLFPSSIAVHGSTVAVLNSGGAGSVAEFTLNNGTLTAKPGEVRSLGLSNTTPPGFVAGPGQVGFSPDGTHLIVAAKHSIDAFEVFNISGNGVLGTTPVRTSSQVPVPFAFSFDPSGHLVDVEAGNSSLSTYTVNPNGSLSAIGTVSDGAKALCWLAGAQGYWFGSNAGSGTVSSFSVNSSGTPSLVNATAATTHPGSTDETVSPDGKVLYVESGGTGAIDAFSIGSGGALSPIETVWNLPVASEGIAAS